MDAGFVFKPRMVGFVCNWCCYGGADLCGVSRLQYPPHIRLIRVMCSGRVDLAHLIRAFSNGADGVFIGGCWPGECHYNTEGNYDALAVVYLFKRLLAHIGIDVKRLRIEWVSASEGIRFANVMNQFSAVIERLGPLCAGEGISEKLMQLKLEALKNLLPYIKLVERERLRVRFEREEEYDEFFSRDDVVRIFRTMIIEKLMASEIMLLLREAPMTTQDIAQRLCLDAADVSRQVNSLVRQGLIRFDLNREMAIPCERRSHLEVGDATKC